MTTLERDLTAFAASDEVATVIKMFQHFRDNYTDEQWDALQDDPHMENLCDALVELEYQHEKLGD